MDAVLTFAEEPFLPALPEIERIMVEHWHEVRGAGSPPLDLDRAMYASLDMAGHILLVTARDEGGALQGYIVNIVHCPLHYRSTLVSKDDAHFIRRPHRQGRTFFRMLRFNEERLAARGVKQAYFHTKARPDLDKTLVFQAAGYEVAEHLLVKRIGG